MPPTSRGTADEWELFVPPLMVPILFLQASAGVIFFFFFFSVGSLSPSML